VFLEWKYHTSGFLGWETHDNAGRVGLGVRHPIIRMTSQRFNDVNHNAPVGYNRAIRKNTARLDCTVDNGKNSVEMFK
jgi:hypothetical protein